MSKFYNPQKQRLEFYQQAATADFWDDHWNRQWQGSAEELAKKVEVTLGPPLSALDQPYGFIDIKKCQNLKNTTWDFF